MGSLSKTVKTQGCQRKFLIFFFCSADKSDKFLTKNIMEDSQSDSENLNVNQRLYFSDLSSDEMEEDTKSDGATKSADNSANRRYILESVQRTKLDFDFVDGLDYHCDYEEEWEDEVEGHEQNLSQTNLMEVPTNKRIRFCLNDSGASGDGLALPTTTNSTALPSASNAALPSTPSSVAIPNAAITSTSNAALASTPNSVALPATPNSEFPSTPNSESESGLSPCRTRSGRVRIEAWSSVEKQMRMQAATVSDFIRFYLSPLAKRNPLI